MRDLLAVVVQNGCVLGQLSEILGSDGHRRSVVDLQYDMCRRPQACEREAKNACDEAIVTVLQGLRHTIRIRE